MDETRTQLDGPEQVAAWVDAFGDRITRFADADTQDWMTAEDIAQETFARLYQRRAGDSGSHPPGSSPSPAISPSTAGGPAIRSPFRTGTATPHPTRNGDFWSAT